MTNHLTLDIAMVLVGTLAAAFCFVKGIMTGVSKLGGWSKARASFAFAAACLLLAITGLVKTGPWMTLLAAGFMLIGAVLVQRQKESRIG